MYFAKMITVDQKNVQVICLGKGIVWDNILSHHNRLTRCHKLNGVVFKAKNILFLEYFGYTPKQ